MALPFLRPLDVSNVHPASRVALGRTGQPTASHDSDELDSRRNGREDAGNLVGMPESDCDSPSKATPKNRSFSDSTPTLSPSPKFKERSQRSRDDHTIITSPRTPRRTDFLARGLSLQMPPSGTTSPSPGNLSSRVPLSPQLDTIDTYGSPATVLPRHSRGLDFSRACTNLHHSTLAEQSTPDSSPTITQRGMSIPFQKSHRNSMTLDSPSVYSTSMWSVNGGMDRTGASSSLGSMSMLASDASTSSSGEDDIMDHDDDDSIMNTPQVLRLRNSTPSAATHSSGGWPPQSASPGASSFLNFQRARLRKGKSRYSSSSASGQSAMASPGAVSPPNAKSHDTNGGYFAREIAMRNVKYRRESLSNPTNELQISSGNESGDEASKATPSTPGVVRRPVTRRGNLLPKTRAFGRIRAELLEEGAPVDAEAKKEAEVIRQVRENDTDADRPPPSATGTSSPTLPTVPGLDAPLEGIPENSAMNVDNGTMSTNKGLFGAFGLQGFTLNKKTSCVVDTSNLPPPGFPRGSSSENSDDVRMDSPWMTGSSALFNGNHQSQEPFRDMSGSRSSTPQATAPPSAADGLRKSNKRRRDDDFDINSIKRRAVSPGVSVQNSPIMAHSPSQNFWGTPKASRESSTGGHAAGERSNSAGSQVNTTPYLGPKRIGLQGMTDTNDGLMKMSIE